jgi:transposase
MLEQAGFEVVVHQPLEVRLFARLKRRKAKNDRLDAVVIAAATAQIDKLKAAQDPRLHELAERLTAYEQASEELTRLKTCMEHITLKDLKKAFAGQVRSLQAFKLKLARELVAKLKAFPDLIQRYDLLRSLPGIGPIVAASMVIRMPELGSMTRGQAASLIGVAPFDRDSGGHRGERHIWGGRSRPRRMLYLSAASAKRCDPGFKAFAQRLASAGKKPKVITVAVMRKLIEAANLVLARQQPWAVRPI